MDPQDPRRPDLIAQMRGETLILRRISPNQVPAPHNQNQWKLNQKLVLGAIFGAFVFVCLYLLVSLFYFSFNTALQKKIILTPINVKKEKYLLKMGFCQ